eukprot:m.123748 g.123748  ORF g.123748 m.123748 type:complete len:388 (+) comp16600_c0_seq5:1250-2413(+)
MAPAAAAALRVAPTVAAMFTRVAPTVARLAQRSAHLQACQGQSCSTGAVLSASPRNMLPALAATARGTMAVSRASSTATTASTGGIPWGMVLSAASLSGLAAGLLYLGRPFDDNDTLGVKSELVNGQDPVPLQYLQRIQARSSHALGQHTSYDRSKGPLLPPPLPDYVAKASDFVLVLDLEDTLVHSEWTPEHGWRTMKRPGVEFFLEYVATRLFGEVVVFSDKNVMDTTGVIEKMDPHQYVLYRLFKGHQVLEDGDHVKDLDCLGRDLRRVIIVDDKPSKYRLQPHNGIKIKPFTGDPDDRALLELIPFLEALVRSDIADVRDVLKRYSSAEDPAAAFLAKKKQLQQQRAAPAPKVQPAAPKPQVQQSSNGGGGSGGLSLLGYKIW